MPIITRSKLAAETRLIGTLTRYELYSIEEFRSEANELFTKRLEAFRKKLAAEMKEPEDREVDVAVDQRVIYEENVRMSTQYGVLLVYGTFERFLQKIYEQTRRFSTVPELRELDFKIDKKWLNYAEYVQYFNDLGMRMDDPAFQWKELEKLRVYRNAIAHHGGRVTAQYLKVLNRWKDSEEKPYKVNDPIEVNAEYVRECIEVVRNTCAKFIEVYLERMGKLGIITLAVVSKRT